jgi:hypothetical protein
MLRVITHFSGCHILGNLNILKYICDLKHDFQAFLPDIYAFSFLKLGNSYLSSKTQFKCHTSWPTSSPGSKVFIL